MNDDDKKMGWRIYQAFSDLKRIPCFCHDLNFDMSKLQDDVYDYFDLQTIETEQVVYGGIEFINGSKISLNSTQLQKVAKEFNLKKVSFPPFPQTPPSPPKDEPEPAPADLEYDGLSEVCCSTCGALVAYSSEGCPVHEDVGCPVCIAKQFKQKGPITHSSEKTTIQDPDQYIAKLKQFAPKHKLRDLPDPIERKL